MASSASRRLPTFQAGPIMGRLPDFGRYRCADTLVATDSSRNREKAGRQPQSCLPDEKLPADVVGHACGRAASDYAAAGTTAAKVSGTSSQPLTNWLTRTKTFVPTGGAPYRAVISRLESLRVVHLGPMVVRRGRRRRECRTGPLPA